MAVVSPTEPEPVVDPVATATAPAVVQAERAADVASSGPRPITPVETEDDDHKGRNVLISILIVLVVAAIVAGIVIAL